MPTSTYTLIAEQSFSSPSASVTFSNIPQTYTHLVIDLSAASSSGNVDAAVRFNGDASNIYSAMYLYGNGSSAGAALAGPNTYAYLDYYGYLSSGNMNAETATVMAYTNTNVYKAVLGYAANAATGADVVTSIWPSTAAVTSLTVLVATSAFAAGSVFRLWGLA